MKITNTRNIGDENFKKKSLIFGGREQKKFNLKEKYEIMTNFHGALNYEDYNSDLILQYDNDDFERAFKYILKLDKPSDVHDKEDKWKLRIKISFPSLDEDKYFSVFHDDKDKLLDKLVYKMYKQGAITLENEIREVDEIEDENEEEIVDENTYKDDRFREIYSPTIDSIGDSLNNDDLRRDVRMMAKYLGHEDKLDELNEIKFDGRLKRSAGSISYLKNRRNGELVKNYQTFKINSNIPNNEEGIEEYFNTIKHELAHLITRAEDGERDFIKYCRKHNIGQSHSLSFDYRYNYFIVCDECHSVLKRQVNKTDRLERIEKHASCGGCGNKDLRLLTKEEYKEWRY